MTGKKACDFTCFFYQTGYEKTEAKLFQEATFFIITFTYLPEVNIQVQNGHPWSTQQTSPMS